MNTEGKREFKGVWFPAEVWLDERLTALDKMILIEVDSLDGEEGCYASNEYLAKFCQCSQTKVSSAISRLKEFGYVTLASFDGRKRVLHSRLTKSVRQTYEICESASRNQGQIVLDESTSKERSKEAETFNSIIDGFTEDDGLREALREFLKYRRAKGKGFTNRALKLNLTKLSGLSSDPKTMTAIVYQTIERGWSGFFALKDGQQTIRSGNGVPEYLREYDL